jgi:hypothetical protein
MFPTLLDEEPALPAQFHARPLIESTPEKRLMLAVLEDAVRMRRQYATPRGTRSRRLLRETDAWFNATRRDYPFAFQSICDALGLDANWVRRLVRASTPAPVATPPVHGVRHAA